jgi:hypothetical protein
MKNKNNFPGMGVGRAGIYFILFFFLSLCRPVFISLLQKE